MQVEEYEITSPPKPPTLVRMTVAFVTDASPHPTGTIPHLYPSGRPSEVDDMVELGKSMLKFEFSSARNNPIATINTTTKPAKAVVLFIRNLG